MVGSLADAEDIVQDTFLKWLSIDHQQIQNTKAYLIRSVVNNCLSHLEALKKKKNECLDAWAQSDWVVSFKEAEFLHFDLENELSHAMAVLSAKLEPMEKAVYVLREAFNMEYEELQIVLDKKKENCRQLFCRAKKNLAQEVDRMKVDWNKHAAMLEGFKKACLANNPADFIHQIAPDLKP